MDHWNDQYHNLSNKSILNDASQGSFNLPDIVSHQEMTAHGTLSGSINIGTFESHINQLAPSLLSQHLFQPCNLLTTHHKLEHIQSNSIANNKHQKAHLVPSDISREDVNDICKPWDIPTSIYKSSRHDSTGSAPLCISNERAKLQKVPPPAHTSNRLNATQSKCKSASLTIKSFGLPITSEVQQDQFSVRNFTLSSTSVCPDAQKTSDTSNTKLQNLLSQQMYIEGFNSPTSTKAMSDLSTIRLNQPLQYITVQPASVGYANSIVLLDKNHIAGNQKIVQPQFIRTALYQNLHPTQGTNIPVYQYSQLTEQHLPVLSQSFVAEPSSNFMSINSKISDCRSVYGNSYLNAIAEPQIAQMSMNSAEAVQAVADSTTKPKRGVRGGSKSNKSNVKIMLASETLDKRKLKDKRCVSYARGESDLEQQIKVYQNQSNQLISSNEMIFERNMIAPTTSSLCSFDPNVFTHAFDSGNLTNIDQESLSCATNLLSSQLMNFSYDKPSNEHGQVFLTNVYGNSFVNLNVINKESSALVSAEQIRTGREVAFSVDNVNGKKVPHLQMKIHLDDEFSHLVKDPIPSSVPKVTFQQRPNKRTFVDCFIDFLQGKRQETLSSLTNVPITKKPDLPKYIPDIRKSSESNSTKHFSNPSHISSTLTTSEFTYAVKALEDPQFINLNMSSCLKAKRSRKLKHKPVVKRDKKRKVDVKFEDDISDSNSTDVMEAFYNDGYDSGSDPLWCPEKAITKNGSSANEKYLPKRRKLKQTLDGMSRTQSECAIPITKKITSFTTRYQKGDFLIDKKDLNVLGSTCYNIWRVDSNRLLQKYEPLSSSDVILHLPTSIYSSWSENMVENYSLLKVQASLSRAKAIKVVDVIREEQFASYKDSHLHKEMNKKCLSSCSCSSIQPSLQCNARHLFQELDRQKLQSELNNYIRQLLKQHLCSTHTSLQFPDEDVASQVQVTNINELLKSCKDRLRDSIHWSPEFHEEVEQHSLMTIIDSHIRELTCQVSGTGKAEKIVKLHGEKYHPESLHVIQVVDEIHAREFHINANIVNKVQAYHRVHALKFHWLSQCLTKVKELKEIDVASSLLLEGPLKDELWMTSVTNNFIQALKDSWDVL